MPAPEVPGFPNLPACTTAGRGIVMTKVELDEVIAFIRACWDRSMDTETQGLSPHRGHRVIGYALGGGLRVGDEFVDRDFYVPVRHLQWKRQPGPLNHELSPDAVAECLRPLLEDPSLGWILFNLKFDYKFLRGEGLNLRGGRFVENGSVKVHDVYIQAHILGGGIELSQSLSLKTLAARELGPAGARDDEAMLADHVKTRMSECSSKLKGDWQAHMEISDPMICAVYAAGDTWKTRKLHRLYESRVMRTTNGHSFAECYAVEIEIMHGLAESEIRGYPVDAPYLRNLLQRPCENNGKPCNLAFCQSCEGSGEAGFLPELHRADQRIMRNLTSWYGVGNINLNSVVQLYPVLFGSLKLPSYLDSRTETGRPSMDDAVLARYVRVLLDSADGFQNEARRKVAKAEMAEVPIALRTKALELLVNLRIRSRASTLADYVMQYIAATVDGAIHCDYRTCGARSARMSGTDPNQQNIPGGELIRKAYVVRPGYIMIVADESQIEYRLTAHYSGEPRLVNGYIADPNFDIHQEVADILQSMGIDIDRRSGKTLNFAILYGAGVSKISNQLGRPYAEVLGFYEGYKRGVPAVWQLKQATEQKILTRVAMQFDTTTRRMVVVSNGYVQDVFGRRYFLKSEYSYVALNRLIQGCAAMLFKHALVRVYRFIADWNAKYGPHAAQVLAVIHDEVQVECRLDTPYWELKEQIQTAMEKWGTLFKVPIVASFSYTLTNWADAKYGGPPSKGKPTERSWDSDDEVRSAVTAFQAEGVMLAAEEVA
jgi:DNA polymerase I-like protein with 3'-5' exonuclease and polymerase domains